MDLHGQKSTEPAALPNQPDVTIEVMLDGDWHQRRPNDDAEIIDQALKVREVAGALFDGLILRAGTGPATTEQN